MRVITEDKPTGCGPCRRQSVLARVTTTAGDVYEATNLCLRPQPSCPRAGMPTGKGYELCKSVCQQTGHAEENVLALAGEAARGGKLEVVGHYYACDPYRAAATRAGIARLVVDGRDAPLTKWAGDAFPCKTGTCWPGHYQGLPGCERCADLERTLTREFGPILRTAPRGTDASTTAQPAPEGPITARDLLEGR